MTTVDIGNLIEIFSYKGEIKHREGEVVRVTQTGLDDMLTVRIFTPEGEPAQFRNFYTNQLVAEVGNVVLGDARLIATIQTAQKMGLVK